MVVKVKIQPARAWVSFPIGAIGTKTDAKLQTKSAIDELMVGSRISASQRSRESFGAPRLHHFRRRQPCSGQSGKMTVGM